MKWCLHFHKEKLCQSATVSQNVAPFVDLRVRTSPVYTKIVLSPSKLSQELGKVLMRPVGISDIIW